MELHIDVHSQIRTPGGSLQTMFKALEMSVDERLALSALVPQVTKAGKSWGTRRDAEAHRLAADFGGARAGSTVGIWGRLS